MSPVSTRRILVMIGFSFLSVHAGCFVSFSDSRLEDRDASIGIRDGQIGDGGDRDATGGIRDAMLSDQQLPDLGPVPDSTVDSMPPVDPISALSGLSLTPTHVGDFSLGLEFTIGQSIRILEISVDGLLRGTVDNVGIWETGNTTVLETFSITTGSTAEEVSIPTDVTIAPGTYRIAGNFTDYHGTSTTVLTTASELSSVTGVWEGGTSLAYPSNVASTWVWGNVNFKFVPVP